MPFNPFAQKDDDTRPRPRDTTGSGASTSPRPVDTTADTGEALDDWDKAWMGAAPSADASETAAAAPDKETGDNAVEDDGWDSAWATPAPREDQGDDAGDEHDDAIVEDDEWDAAWAPTGPQEAPGGEGGEDAGDKGDEPAERPEENYPMPAGDGPAAPGREASMDDAGWDWAEPTMEDDPAMDKDDDEDAGVDWRNMITGAGAPAADAGFDWGDSADDGRDGNDGEEDSPAPRPRNPFKRRARRRADTHEAVTSDDEQNEPDPADGNKETSDGRPEDMQATADAGWDWDEPDDRDDDADTHAADDEDGEPDGEPEARDATTGDEWDWNEEADDEEETGHPRGPGIPARLRALLHRRDDGCGEASEDGEPDDPDEEPSDDENPREDDWEDILDPNEGSDGPGMRLPGGKAIIGLVAGLLTVGLSIGGVWAWHGHQKAMQARQERQTACEAYARARADWTGLARQAERLDVETGGAPAKTCPGDPAKAKRSLEEDVDRLEDGIAKAAGEQWEKTAATLSKLPKDKPSAGKSTLAKAAALAKQTPRDADGLKDLEREAKTILDQAAKEQKAADDAKRKADEEAKRKADEEARKKAEEEAAKRQQEQAATPAPTYTPPSYTPTYTAPTPQYTAPQQATPTTPSTPTPAPQPAPSGNTTSDL